MREPTMIPVRGLTPRRAMYKPKAEPTNAPLIAPNTAARGHHALVAPMNEEPTSREVSKPKETAPDMAPITPAIIAPNRPRTNIAVTEIKRAASSQLVSSLELKVGPV